MLFKYFGEIYHVRTRLVGFGKVSLRFSHIFWILSWRLRSWKEKFTKFKEKYANAQQRLTNDFADPAIMSMSSFTLDILHFARLSRHRNWILKWKQLTKGDQTHEKERSREWAIYLSSSAERKSEKGLFDHKNSAPIDLTRWRPRTEPLPRILFVVFVLAILPRWLRITRNALVERLTNPIEEGEDSRSLSSSLTKTRTILRKW